MLARWPWPHLALTVRHLLFLLTPPAASFARRKKTTFLAILRRISPYLPRLGIFIVIFFLFLLLSLNRCEIELGSERVASHHFVLPKL